VLCTASKSITLFLWQVSFGATSASLSNRKQYPYFTRTVPTDWYLAEAVCEILKQFGWHTVYLLSPILQTEQSFYLKLAELALQVGIRVNTEFKYAEYDQVSVDGMAQSLASTSARIIISLSNARDSAFILQAASKYGMLERGYMWLMAGSINHNVLPASILPDLLGVLCVKLQGGVGTSWERFSSWWPRNSVSRWSTTVPVQLSVDVFTKPPPPRCAFAYDAVFRAAFALSDAGLERADNADVVFDAMVRRNFTGLTGSVSNLQNGDRVTDNIFILIDTFDGSTFSPAMKYSRSHQLQLLGSVVWIGNSSTVPIDSTYICICMNAIRPLQNLEFQLRRLS
jgi:ABC-type branched-subunit amino acid transport system substrate-binding protein